MQSSSKKHIMIIAGEASGDMHAAHLVDAIKAKNPDITFSGLGGPKMKSSGVEIYEDLTKIAVVGFIEVLKHYAQFKTIFNQFLKRAIELKPQAVILVDYPGFNLRMAKKLKEHGIKVIYYISPQVWAWKENRVADIKKHVDHMLVLFQFEKDFYAKRDFDVDFVGHPLVDSIKIESPKEALLNSFGLSTNKLTIGLLPGSRSKEIKDLLPIMLDAAEILYDNNSSLQFLLLKAPGADLDFFEGQVRSRSLPVKIIDNNNTYDGINASNLCVVASGTATLETAILNKPMVVVYKTSLFTYLLAKLFVKIPNIGLVNVVAQKKIVPECIQHEATGSKIAEQLQSIFTNELTISEIKEELIKVKESLGKSGASEKAANRVLTYISE